MGVKMLGLMMKENRDTSKLERRRESDREREREC